MSVMPQDTDVLAVLAEVVGTVDPIGLLQRLEEQGLTVSVAGEGYNPTEHRAAMLEFQSAMAPMWEQANATRLQLIQDGWSEEMAEHLGSHVAHLWLNVLEVQMVKEAASDD